jgi:uncharacterized protein YndB with AHSA1/START domain
MEKTKVTKDLENKLLIIERVFDAPKSRLWQAYADKDLFVRWWGPEGWETTVKEFDFKPGGRNHYGMKCVDENQGEWFGRESWGIMQYESMDEPDNFVYKDYFADAEGNIQEGMPAIAITIELVESDGQTTLVTRCQAESAEDIEKLVAMGMIEGLSSSADKLERLIKE